MGVSEMRKIVKSIMIVFEIILLTILFACTPPNPSTFNLSPELINNPQLDTLVTMQVEVDDQTLVVTINNQTDDDFTLQHPMLEYFDGDDWRVIPREEFTDVEIVAVANDIYTCNLPLVMFQHPNYGLFRLRRSLYDRHAEGAQFNPNQIHDLVVEFTLD